MRDNLVVTTAQLTRQDCAADGELTEAMTVIEHCARRAADVTQGLVPYPRPTSTERRHSVMAAAINGNITAGLEVTLPAVGASEVYRGLRSADDPRGRSRRSKTAEC